MQPAARIAAAIELLDEILDGAPAERSLTAWARRSRFAGSKDRNAIRDYVYDALRCRRSFAALGGAETGRGLMIGALKAQGAPLDDLFNGIGHAPSPLTKTERATPLLETLPAAVRLDCPDWLMPMFETDLEAQAEPALMALRERAPIFLRVNTLKADVATALNSLASDDIEAKRIEGIETALVVTANERRIRASTAFESGLVELQDASSQAAVHRLAGQGAALDYCAGGGGKSLALAAMGYSVTAHDIDPRRMGDLPARSQRAGATVDLRSPDDLGDGEYDLVLADAPCSGSGTWRRTPDAKWRLTPQRLEDLTRIQADVIRSAAAYVAPSGRLAYATCSVFSCENDAIVDAFCSEGRWQVIDRMKLVPSERGDGFYLAILERNV
ncbi:RsmB/NOP family class I SAM-dependent RNA methyltransferase [Marivivens sp. LCG002]|uniref:RsmB/NOP family class I SAM-dependent RNA methyltransferase n=1 Tax=Marivivens sp. LCG002 TaxID=3051171 RepID=UPI0025535695|nr:RsmB/NOP family class I SAM-dependent RNA methyltransferase [Marivivens sp. LCG002]WIV52006.1 RsmB/NOP family class I SAM-dependent RNA methyltransferase [Marivivens sp. LCG002]